MSGACRMSGWARCISALIFALFLVQSTFVALRGAAPVERSV